MTSDGRLQRRARERAGRRAEALAALWLQLKGYRILDRRARTPLGELDLVAVKGRTLAFVEVKARIRRGAALEAITPALRGRVEQAARLWAGRRRGMDDKHWRFDVVAIVPGRLPHHLPDAWRPEK
ncbi:MAG: YraN family protein [Alphaproteobacteria bacterium]|nr:YraN family protein [Alphaproteobacteria bacterium]